MIVSRGIRLIKNASIIAKQKFSSNIMQIRHSGHGVEYRGVADAPRNEVIFAELGAGFMWWWVFWHLWHDWGHIVGEFEYPDSSKWTDEELGIPPDDFD
ncbi:hypothetical protein PV328_008689 [Microctonus aethiopoides]|uniref:NADH dehydrogenase [ubiquinone] 1 beta subcomplex subunit 2, mitochondrial n=1 Tax=Microctonus aethiopoides TaxID=144406 RepID=A0AA39KRD3_9HYME|nr:hypothetical protein PV328_008689 [Microctonus aethiopoides]